MGMTGSGLGGSFNDDLGGGSAFGGMEEDQWNRLCEQLKNEWERNFQTQCREAKIYTDNKKNMQR